jgi:hypothetical protein
MLAMGVNSQSIQAVYLPGAVHAQRGWIRELGVSLALSLVFRPFSFHVPTLFTSITFSHQGIAVHIINLH